jgi:hypothetical protein
VRQLQEETSQDSSVAAAAVADSDDDGVAILMMHERASLVRITLLNHNLLEAMTRIAHLPMPAHSEYRVNCDSDRATFDTSSVDCSVAAAAVADNDHDSVAIDDARAC